METSKAHALALQFPNPTSRNEMPPEMLAGITRALKQLPTEDAGRIMLRIVKQWGFYPERFARLLDYLRDPWHTGLEETFTPEQLAEYFYRCGEIKENGEFQPVEMHLRRPPATEPGYPTKAKAFPK